MYRHLTLRSVVVSKDSIRFLFQLEDECAGPSELAELHVEQLHAKLNSGHSRRLDIAAPLVASNEQPGGLGTHLVTIYL